VIRVVSTDGLGFEKHVAWFEPDSGHLNRKGVASSNPVESNE